MNIREPDMGRIVALLAVPILLLFALPAEAQRNCTKGKPCGDTCIARDRTCRVGTGSASSGASAPAAPRAGSALPPCTVARVTDGDTLVCADGRRVRLLLVDAPETDQADFGLRAKLFLEQLAPRGSRVTLEADVQRQDRYGRTLAHVRTPRGRWANLALVREGYALPLSYPPNLRFLEAFRAASDSARVEGRGLWAAGGFACTPSDHRRDRC